MLTSHFRAVMLLNLIKIFMPLCLLPEWYMKTYLKILTFRSTNLGFALVLYKIDEIGKAKFLSKNCLWKLKSCWIEVRKNLFFDWPEVLFLQYDSSYRVRENDIALKCETSRCIKRCTQLDAYGAFRDLVPWRTTIVLKLLERM